MNTTVGGSQAFPLFAKENLALHADYPKYSGAHEVALIFPDMFHFLQGSLPAYLGFDLTAATFPAWSADQCPEIRYSVGTGGFVAVDHLTLRNPTLLPFQILGFLVGIVGAFVLRPQHPSMPIEKRSHEQKWTNSLFWPTAMLYFAMMNATSIFAHAIYEPHTASYKLWLKLDVMATGLSSFNFMVGSLSSLSSNIAAATASTSSFLALNAMLLACFIKVGLTSWLWQAEALYLLPVAMCSLSQLAMLTKRLAFSHTSAMEKLFTALHLSSAALFTASPTMSIASCALFGDARFSVIQTAFFGCAVSCFWFSPWLRTVRASATT